MATSETSSGLANSFTDLMTSLAVIFILLLCAQLNNIKEDIKKEGEKTRISILDELQKELKDYMVKGVKVERDPKDPLSLLILVPAGLLEFKRNEAIIPPDGKEFLGEFIPKLAKIVCSEKYKNDISSIVVEGHTDSSGPDQHKDQHNLKLSQDRAMAVVSESLKALEENPESEQDAIDQMGQFLQLLSASGRGSAELVKDETGEENPPLSRRVVFKIRMRSMEQKTFVETIGGASGR